MAVVYLLLGSNQGDKIELLNQARNLIGEYIGEIKIMSSLYESESWGFVSENFINQVVCVETKLDPEKLLEIIHNIEAYAGRVRVYSKTYQARTLDIDILFYDNLVLKTNRLVIPHPHLQERLFTLLPLSEIAPQLVHPVLGLTIQELLERCNDKSQVWVCK